MSTATAPARPSNQTATSTWKWTYEDYCTLPADGRRHEIVDGEHLVTPAPRAAHQIVSMALTEILLTQRRLVGGRLLAAPFDVVLSDHDVVQPDLLWVSAERLHRIDDKNLKGAPDLVVEVLSPSTTKVDETIKRHLYERSQVVEYWTVDPDLERVRIYRRHDGAFAPPIELWAERRDRLTSPLFPELDVEVSVVFE